MPSNHLILCRLLLLLPSIFSSIRVFSSESALRIRWSTAYTRGNGSEKWKKVKSLSRVWLFETPWTVAYHAPSLDFPQSTHTFSNVAPHKKICLIRCSWAYDGLTNWYLATLWISASFLNPFLLPIFPTLHLSNAKFHWREFCFVFVSSTSTHFSRSEEI